MAKHKKIVPYEQDEKYRKKTGEKPIDRLLQFIFSNTESIVFSNDTHWFVSHMSPLSKTNLTNYYDLYLLF